mgnify:FL=1
MDIDAEVLGMIVNKSIFRVVAQGGILQNVGEETKTAALVLNGICGGTETLNLLLTKEV